MRYTSIPTRRASWRGPTDKVGMGGAWRARSHHHAADRCDTTASGPTASHAAASLVAAVQGPPAMRYTP